MGEEQARASRCIWWFSGCEWVSVWSPKHLPRRPGGSPDITSKCIQCTWRILEDLSCNYPSGTNILCHPWKRKITFPATFKGDVLVPKRVCFWFIWLTQCWPGEALRRTPHNCPLPLHCPGQPCHSFVVLLSVPIYSVPINLRCAFRSCHFNWKIAWHPSLNSHMVRSSLWQRCMDEFHQPHFRGQHMRQILMSLELL